MSSMTSKADYDFLLKLLVIGDRAVGKSSLLLRFADGTWRENYVTTIGVDFKFKNVTIDDSSVRLQIWDTAGEERFRTVFSSFYRGAHGAIVVYDTTNAQSFKNVESWIREVDSHTEGIPKLIVGNKCDMTEAKEVPTEVGQTFAEKLGCLFLETSAKDFINVNEAFIAMASQIKNSIRPQDFTAFKTKMPDLVEIKASTSVENSYFCCY